MHDLLHKLHTALPVGAVLVSAHALDGALQSFAYIVTISYTSFKFITEYRQHKNKNNVKSKN
jgi:hypothetical protein